MQPSDNIVSFVVLLVPLTYIALQRTHLIDFASVMAIFSKRAVRYIIYTSVYVFLYIIHDFMAHKSHRFGFIDKSHNSKKKGAIHKKCAPRNGKYLIQKKW
jgi:hypothetical protein